MTSTRRAPVTNLESTPALRPGSPEFAELLARIAAGAHTRELEGIAPREQVEWIRASGVSRLRLPLEQGGAGVSLREFFEVLIALAAADCNLAHLLRVHYWATEQHLIASDPVFRERGLTMIRDGAILGVGFSEQSSRPAGLEFDTEFTPDPDGGWRLNGTKFYCTGTLYSDHTQIWGAAPDGRIAGAIIPVDREGVTVEDDWDGFGQRQTGSGTTRLENVRVSDAEFFDLGEPGGPWPPNHLAPFLQLYLQAVMAGILQSVRTDAVELVRGRRRGFSHASVPQVPAQDPQVLQVVGEIAAAAFAAEAIVLAAADAVQAAADSTVDGVADGALAVAAQLASSEAKVVVDGLAHAAATKLFDAGGASATQAVRNLDRHWRNVRTISTHNPTFLKASAVGDHLVNGAGFPANGYF
jgi:alkylation response protein AidB-like acyl-CoA dehydrogenase